MTIIYASSHDLHKKEEPNLVLLAFSSTWCEPCKRMHSVLEKIDYEMNGAIKIVITDLKENDDISKQLDIIGTPTLILLKNGEVLGKIIGYHQKEVITEFIQKYT